MNPSSLILYIYGKLKIFRCLSWIKVIQLKACTENLEKNITAILLILFYHLTFSFLFSLGIFNWKILIVFSTLAWHQHISIFLSRNTKLKLKYQIVTKSCLLRRNILFIKLWKIALSFEIPLSSIRDLKTIRFCWPFTSIKCWMSLWLQLVGGEGYQY